MNKGQLLKQVYENNKDFEKSKEIVKVMDIADRKYFVEEGNIYLDQPLSIGYEQTISQPSTVARMLLLLNLKKKMTVLDIGSGSGWNAVLISLLVYPGKVISVERIRSLHEFALENTKRFSKETKRKINIKFIFADAFDRKSEVWKQKYDRIIIAAMLSGEMQDNLKEMGLKLLKNNGMLLFPFKEGLELWKKEKNSLFKVLREEGYAFVPLLRGVK